MVRAARSTLAPPPPPPPPPPPLTPPRGHPAEVPDPRPACPGGPLSSVRSKKVEADFEGYKGNAELLGTGAVVVCPEGEWRAEVQRLRAAHPGHFFAPVFPR